MRGRARRIASAWPLVAAMGLMAPLAVTTIVFYRIVRGVSVKQFARVGRWFERERSMWR